MHSQRRRAERPDSAKSDEDRIHAEEFVRIEVDIELCQSEYALYRLVNAKDLEDGFAFLRRWS